MKSFHGRSSFNCKLRSQCGSDELFLVRFDCFILGDFFILLYFFLDFIDGVTVVWRLFNRGVYILSTELLLVLTSPILFKLLLLPLAEEEFFFKLLGVRNSIIFSMPDLFLLSSLTDPSSSELSASSKRLTSVIS